MVTNNIPLKKKSQVSCPFEQEPTFWELVCNKAKTREL